jgi:paraquat-inducible protein A
MKVLLPSSKMLYVLASILLVLGVSLPLITVSKLVVISTTYTLLTGVFTLLSNGQVVLFIAVFIFSVVLPLVKMFFLYKVIFSHNATPSPTIGRYIKLMHDYGRWAMLDVMVVAVLIVASKLSVLASVEVHVGLYVFGLSVILVMLLTQRAVKLASA